MKGSADQDFDEEIAQDPDGWHQDDNRHEDSLEIALLDGISVLRDGFLAGFERRRGIGHEVRSGDSGLRPTVVAAAAIGDNRDWPIDLKGRTFSPHERATLLHDGLADFSVYLLSDRRFVCGIADSPIAVKKVISIEALNAFDPVDERGKLLHFAAFERVVDPALDTVEDCGGIGHFTFFEQVALVGGHARHLAAKLSAGNEIFDRLGDNDGEEKPQKEPEEESGRKFHEEKGG